MMKQAANIPLVCELGIDKLSFDDFSLDVDAMITAALRMFMELGMVQKFKIDYEVRPPTLSDSFLVYLSSFLNAVVCPHVSSPDTVQMAADCQKKLQNGSLSQLETRIQCVSVHVCHANGKYQANLCGSKIQNKSGQIQLYVQIIKGYKDIPFYSFNSLLVDCCH